MNNEETAKALGRIEAQLEAIHDKLDDQVLPGCVKHDKRISILEKVLYTTQGVILLGSAGVVIGKDLIVEWVRKKVIGH